MFPPNGPRWPGPRPYGGVPSYQHSNQGPYSTGSQFIPPLPPRPAFRPAQKHRAPGAPPDKQTMLWVGKIALTVEEETVESLLKACGGVKEWKPVKDTDTGVSKGFGFVTFEEPENVEVALLLLHGLEIDGQALQLKANTATNEYLEWWKEQEDRTSMLDEQKQAAAEKIEMILKKRAPLVQEAATAADNFLSSLEENPLVSASTVRPSFQSEQQSPPRRATKEKRQRSGSREGYTDRREWRIGSDRHYKEQLRFWERYETVRIRSLEKEADRERDLAAERARHVQADEQAVDSEDELEPWERPIYTTTRKAADRRRRREKELQTDQADLEKEKQEEDEMAAREQQAAAAAQLNVAAKDSIFQAMMAAAAPKLADTMASKVTELPPSPSGPTLPQAIIATRRVMNKGAFVEDEEEEATERRLIPLDYSKKESRKDTSMQYSPSSRMKKELQSMIPKDKQAVYDYRLKWYVLDGQKGADEVWPKVTQWIGKKIKDLMGEEEPSFCEFIVDQLKGKSSAESLRDSLQAVLDEDADDFVRKLFQVMIYETEKLDRKIQ